MNDIKNNKRIPECVGVIIDGNRRWSKEHGIEGAKIHDGGRDKLKEFVIWARDAGINHVVAYVFSTENWKRSAGEVKNLMNLIRFVFKKDLKDFKKEGVRVSVIGQRERLDPDIRDLIEKTEDDTKNEKRTHLTLALSYGGRAEIVAAVKRLVDKEEKDVTESSFSSALWTKGIPDPDIIIRTGGESRLSNFLPWQSVYSELFFTDTLWPAFTKDEFINILDDFATRDRRRGN